MQLSQAGEDFLTRELASLEFRIASFAEPLIERDAAPDEVIIPRRIGQQREEPILGFRKLAGLFGIAPELVFDVRGQCVDRHLRSQGRDAGRRLFRIRIVFIRSNVCLTCTGMLARRASGGVTGPHT